MLKSISYGQAMHHNIIVARSKPLSIIYSRVGWFDTEYCGTVGHYLTLLLRAEHNAHTRKDVRLDGRTSWIAILPLVDPEPSHLRLRLTYYTANWINIRYFSFS